ncbi:MAG: response regulator transcription factor [Mariprofundus sp.]|nr:response regulator transcription factor [Mariprofundus sp.]
MTHLLLVDDDTVFCQVLGKAFEKRGFDVWVAHDVSQAMELVGRRGAPDYAVVDLSMPGGLSGLSLVEQLHKRFGSQLGIVVLTGYASVATAVEAIKLGAVHYLAKPANADEIIQAFGKQQGDSDADVVENAVSVKRLEWEYIQKVLNDCDGNISAAARKLGLHRRTLQRKLSKRPVKN